MTDIFLALLAILLFPGALTVGVLLASAVFAAFQAWAETH